MKKQNGYRFTPTGNSSFIILPSSFPRRVAGGCELRGEEQPALDFLESVPEVAAKLKEPNTVDENFEKVVKSAQDAAVLVLVY
jgi:hypothetical protein